MLLLLCRAPQLMAVTGALLRRPLGLVTSASASTSASTRRSRTAGEPSEAADAETETLLSQLRTRLLMEFAGLS